MKSLRVWLSGIALGAVLLVCAPAAKAQSNFPDGFTYQGVIVDNGVPYTGNATLTITLGPQNGTVLWSETLANVPVFEGVFNVVVGRSTPFPSTMNFNEQYFMTVVVANSGGTVTLPPTALWSSPYAINAGTVNGMLASSVPLAGALFPVPIGTGYTGLAKMDPAFLPAGIPNSLLATADITQINNIGPNTTGNFTITGGSGVDITPGTNGLTVGLSNVLGSTSSTSTTLTIQNSEANGNDALLVKGGIGANNSSGTPDGDGITTAQTYWADQVAVPSTTGTSLVILNTLVNSGSTIIITPVSTTAASGGLTITSVGAGTFTVSAKNAMGVGVGLITALNYMVINH